MIDGHRVLGVIAARGGSKGLPRKNVLALAGRPLIAWTIEAARESRYLDRVIASTDDDEIARIAKQYGCETPFRRPARLARDETPGVEPVLHAVRELPGFDYVVLLQPTSPLRTAADIDAALEKCLAANADACVSVTPADTPPEWMYTLDGADRLAPLVAGEAMPSRRQDAARVYELNGAVYAVRVSALLEQGRLVTSDAVGYVMPPDRSADIDTELDLRWCELLMGRDDG